jgi:hypothetical protein
MAAIENYLLTDERPAERVYLAQQYVTKRGEKAQQFMDKYQAVMKKEFEDTNNQMFKNDDYRKSIERQIAAMTNSLSAKTAEVLVEELVSEKTTWEKTGQVLSRRLIEKSPEEALTLLLDACIRCKAPETVRSLLYMTQSVPHLKEYAGMSDGYDEDDSAAAPEKTSMDISKNADQWKKLLADTRILTAFGPDSISALTAQIIEGLYGDTPATGFEQRQVLMQLGKRTSTVLKARAEARLAGKKESELPAFPSADNVTPEQRKKLVDDITKADGAALEKQIADLSMDSLLVLGDETGNNEKLNAKLAPIANRVAAVRGDVDDAGIIKQQESAAKGKVLDKTVVEQMLTLCRDLTQRGMYGQCSISRQPCLGGIEIWITEFAPTNKQFKARTRYMRGNEKPTVSAWMQAEDIHGNATWYIEKPAATGTNKVESAKSAAEDDLIADAASDVDSRTLERAKESQDEFWKSVEQFCSGKGNVCRAANINFSGNLSLPKSTDKDDSGNE